jgi:high-affinity nickel permease
MTPTFSRIWLMKMVAHLDLRDDAGQLPQGLAHKPCLQAHMLESPIVAFDLGAGHQGRHGVDDDHIDAAAADQDRRLISSACSPLVGLADEQVVHVHPEMPSA